MIMFLEKARQNAEKIRSEIDKLLRESASLSKKEMEHNQDTILAYIDDAIDAVDKESKEIMQNLRNHRKYTASKMRFLRRHYKNFSDIGKT